MKKYYLLGIKDYNDTNCLHHMGYYYDKQKDYENMGKYYNLIKETDEDEYGEYYSDSDYDDIDEEEMEDNSNNYYTDMYYSNNPYMNSYLSYIHEDHTYKEDTFANGDEESYNLNKKMDTIEIYI